MSSVERRNYENRDRLRIVFFSGRYTKSGDSGGYFSGKGKTPEHPIDFLVGVLVAYPFFILQFLWILRPGNRGGTTLGVSISEKL